MTTTSPLFTTLVVFVGAHSMDRDVGRHRAWMAAAQSVFRVAAKAPPSRPGTTPSRAVPLSDDKAILLDRFWRRVADLTTRYYDTDQRWIGGLEIRQWNKANRNVCIVPPPITKLMIVGGIGV